MLSYSYLDVIVIVISKLSARILSTDFEAGIYDSFAVDVTGRLQPGTHVPDLAC